jgi:hypothetical protein
MHGPINVKSPNNISEWQMGFNSAFKGLNCYSVTEERYLTRRLRVFENRMLRRIFGPKRDEVTNEWRKLHNEELNDMYCSPKIVRVIKSEE